MTITNKFMHVNIYEYINFLLKEKLLIFITVLLSAILFPLITYFFNDRFEWPIISGENYYSIEYKIFPLSEVVSDPVYEVNKNFDQLQSTLAILTASYRQLLSDTFIPNVPVHNDLFINYPLSLFKTGEIKKLVKFKNKKYKWPEIQVDKVAKSENSHIIKFIYREPVSGSEDDFLNLSNLIFDKVNIHTNKKISIEFTKRLNNLKYFKKNFTQSLIFYKGATEHGDSCSSISCERLLLYLNEMNLNDFFNIDLYGGLLYLDGNLFIIPDSSSFFSLSEPSVHIQKKEKPSLFLIVFLGVIFGFMLSIFIVNVKQAGYFKAKNY